MVPDVTFAPLYLAGPWAPQSTTPWGVIRDDGLSQRLCSHSDASSGNFPVPESGVCPAGTYVVSPQELTESRRGEGGCAQPQVGKGLSQADPISLSCFQAIKIGATVPEMDREMLCGDILLALRGQEGPEGTGRTWLIEEGHPPAKFLLSLHSPEATVC